MRMAARARVSRLSEWVHRHLLVVCYFLMSLGVGVACSNSPVEGSTTTIPQETTIQKTSTSQAAGTTQGPIEVESLAFKLLDGSTLQMTAPLGAIDDGVTSHTVVSDQDVVVVVETGNRSFGTERLTQLTEVVSEPYHGGELFSGELGGPKALVWIGPRHSLVLAYDSISQENARAVLDSLNIVEEPQGVVALGRLAMEQTTVTVPLRGGGGLEIERASGPDEKEVIVERETGGAVTSIRVAYPTASANVYIPPNRDGASLVGLVELIDIEWLP